MTATLDRPHPRGVALLAVIWLIGILAIACISVMRIVTFDAQIASARVHGARARQVAEMGAAVACNPMVKRSDPLLLRANHETGESYEVKMTSEGSRFNINLILAQNDTPLLRSMFIDWGLDLDEAQAVVDALKDWIDPDDNVSLNGAEKPQYEDAGRINQPFNHPFYSLDEMRLVRGMDLVEAVRPDWRDWFTVWSSGGLDLNEAPAEFIALAADVPIERADIIPETVRGADGALHTDDDVPFQNVQDALALIGTDSYGQPNILRRFAINDTTDRIESLGSAEGAKVLLTLVIRNRSGLPAILERKIELVP